MQIDESRLLREVQALVRIPSVREVETIAEHILRQLRAAGVADAHRDEDGNVIGALGSGEGLLLNAHLDTVGVEGFRGDPFDARIEDDCVVGRGATDCKAGVAAMLEIARLLAGAPLRRRVIFAFTVWEEGLAPAPNGAFGAARRADAAEAIVMESTVKSSSRMGVIVGCNGILRLDLRVRGTACHSSKPQRGDNALYRAAEMVGRFRESFAPETLPAADFRVMGRTLTTRCVASLTEIRALQGRNIIPGECVVGMDCRLVPGQDAAAMVRRVRAFASQFGRGKVAVEGVRCIHGHVCDSDQLIRACRAAAQRQGFQAPLSIMPGRTDSTIFQHDGGIPAVVFGPGSSGQAHTDHERLSLPNFYRSAQACLDAVLELAGGR